MQTPDCLRDGALQAISCRDSRLGAWQGRGICAFLSPLLRGKAAALHLAHSAEAPREGWRSRLLGLSSPAHNPTRRCPHGPCKHKGNDRLGQSLLSGCSAPWDPLRRLEVVCGRLFLWSPSGLCPLGAPLCGGRRTVERRRAWVVFYMWRDVTTWKVNCNALNL